jgi:hypothetical protein
MKSKLAAILMIAGGLLIATGGKVPEFRFGNPFAVSIAGTTAVLVYEKTQATVDQTIAIRKASDFVAANKLVGFISADQDDPWAKPIVEDAAKKNIKPPLVAYIQIADKRVSKVVKIAPWKDSLENSK